MPIEFALPVSVAAHWKLKIRDRERVEPPHVSVLHGTRCWRWGLRERAFLDREPPPRLVPRDVCDAISDAYDEICAAWDKAYPHKPVSSKER
jgi:hypothetical protein